MCDGEFDGENVVFNKWEKVNERVQRVAITTDTKGIAPWCNAHEELLQRHIYIKRIQNTKLNRLKVNNQK